MPKVNYKTSGYFGIDKIKKALIMCLSLCNQILIIIINSVFNLTNMLFTKPDRQLQEYHDLSVQYILIVIIIYVCTTFCIYKFFNLKFLSVEKI